MSNGERLSSSSAGILLGIARPLLPAFPELAARERDTVEVALGDGLSAQIASMPRYLLLPFLIGLRVFDWLPFLRYGRSYSGLAIDTQRRVIALWSDAPLSPLRDFIKLIRSCALFHYLDHPLVRERLEEISRPEAAASGANNES